jgi:hypothetical protein
MTATMLLLCALGFFYGGWVLATYALEGRQRAFLRPEATQLRLIYTVTANVLLGVLVAGGILRLLSEGDFLTPARAGFGGIGRTAIAVVIGGVLGTAFYVKQGAPSRHPMVVLNGFAQVWPVSVAEVLVCWAVVGAVVEAQLRDQDVPRFLSALAAALIASLLFGLYHLAHSPPFNTWAMIGKLTLIGLVTSLFFFVSRDIYGTIVFHNFFAIFGVLQALGRADKLKHYESPVPPLLVIALISLGLLIAVHGLVL